MATEADPRTRAPEAPAPADPGERTAPRDHGHGPPVGGFGVGAPGVPAVGRGPNSGAPLKHGTYRAPGAGWGAVRSVASMIVRRHATFRAPIELLRMNHERTGFDCPGCAWPDDRKVVGPDLCENGVKHLTWEMDKGLVGRAFFAEHTVTELEGWSDHALEKAGRLAEPMAYDPADDKYHPVTWEQAFAIFGRAIAALPSASAGAFYTSGRLGNEASFMYSLMARELGTNNLPDCSNMCHEASGRALRASIGSGKGTTSLDDWEHADTIVLLGVNVASNAPRMMNSLVAAGDRGAQIVHVNPLREIVSNESLVPNQPLRLARNASTTTGTLTLQPRIGGDMALLRGVGKALWEMHDDGDVEAVDAAFVAEHTDGADEHRAACAATPWDELERQSGVSEVRIRDLARVLRSSERTIFAWCLGISQQEHGVDTVREIVNLALLRGQIGREGAGLCPIRGHSNVQGNRTCGINHSPTEEWCARIDAACGIDSPREMGLDTVHVIAAMQRGEVELFVGMGGNFALAAPDLDATGEALRGCAMTVQVSTKLNRSHLVHGREALILPCLARSERDDGPTGSAHQTVEDSMSMVHRSLGHREPPSPVLLSEPAIVAGLARAALPGSATPWESWIDDHDRVRDVMADALPGFADFNARIHEPGGFRLHQAAREREWKTESGRAGIHSAELPDVVPAAGRLSLSTMRSHDQWNTTIYTDDDRYRGLHGSRTVLFMHPDDLAERGLVDLDRVDITSIGNDGGRRTVYGYRAISHDISRGSVAGYMPELNVLLPLADSSRQSDQPVMKHVAVEVERAATA